MAHKCPAPKCGKTVADSMLMCRNDWYRVPVDLRNAVWAAWQDGAGQGSDEHIAAIEAAISSLESK